MRIAETSYSAFESILCYLCCLLFLFFIETPTLLWSRSMTSTEIL